MEKQNRAERRRSKFGGGRATEHGGWPTHEPNPIFRGEPPPGEVTPVAPDSVGTPPADTSAERPKADTDEEAAPGS